MGYVTHVQLAERPGALELAQLASSDTRPVVDAALLDATLRGADRTAWTAPQRADADAALAVIDDAVADADARIDGFLSQRGYVLPLSPVPGVVAGWSRDIARYLLHKNRIEDERSDPVARAYRDAMALLKLTSEGRFSLSAEQAAQPLRTGDMPEIAAGARVFDAGSLQDF